ncbi:acyl carrier protein [compost metagenome]
MNKAQIFETLNEIFRDVFDNDSIVVNEETTAKDVDGWDSLMHITLISSVEVEFGIKFEMKDVISMKNVGEMANIIEREV